jgi:hypothetical protein
MHLHKVYYLHRHPPSQHYRQPPSTMVPEAVITDILLPFLAAKEICVIQQTSKSFYVAGGKEDVWDNLCSQKWRVTRGSVKGSAASIKSSKALYRHMHLAYERVKKTALRHGISDIHHTVSTISPNVVRDFMAARFA